MTDTQERVVLDTAVRHKILGRVPRPERLRVARIFDGRDVELETYERYGNEPRVFRGRVKATARMFAGGQDILSMSTVGHGDLAFSLATIARIRTLPLGEKP
jgi:hypothetical protein